MFTHLLHLLRQMLQAILAPTPMRLIGAAAVVMGLACLRSAPATYAQEQTKPQNQAQNEQAQANITDTAPLLRLSGTDESVWLMVPTQSRAGHPEGQMYLQINSGFNQNLSPIHRFSTQPLPINIAVEDNAALIAGENGLIRQIRLTQHAGGLIVPDQRTLPTLPSQVHLYGLTRIDNRAHALAILLPTTTDTTASTADKTDTASETDATTATTSSGQLTRQGMAQMLGIQVDMLPMPWAALPDAAPPTTTSTTTQTTTTPATTENQTPASDTADQSQTDANQTDLNQANSTPSAQTSPTDVITNTPPARWIWNAQNRALKPTLQQVIQDLHKQDHPTAQYVLLSLDHNVWRVTFLPETWGQACQTYTGDLIDLKTQSTIERDELNRRLLNLITNATLIRHPDQAWPIAVLAGQQKLFIANANSQAQYTQQTLQQLAPLKGHGLIGTVLEQQLVLARQVDAAQTAASLSLDKSQASNQTATQPLSISLSLIYPNQSRPTSLATVDIDAPSNSQWGLVPRSNAVDLYVGSNTPTDSSIQLAGKRVTLLGQVTDAPLIQEQNRTRLDRSLDYVILIVVLTISSIVVFVIWPKQLKINHLYLKSDQALAAPSRRFMGLFIDLMPCFYLVNALFENQTTQQTLYFWPGMGHALKASDLYPALSVIGIYTLHTTLFELLFARSFGKIVTRTQLTTLQGEKPTLRQRLLRGLIKPLDLVCMPLGTMVLFHNRQRFADLVMKTVVVTQAIPQQPPSPPPPPPPPSSSDDEQNQQEQNKDTQTGKDKRDDDHIDVRG